MSLVERLEREARRLDLDKVWGPFFVSHTVHGYNQEAAELRDLLLEAAKALR